MRWISIMDARRMCVYAGASAAETLTEQMLSYCQMDPQEQTAVNLNQITYFL